VPRFIKAKRIFVVILGRKANVKFPEIDRQAENLLLLLCSRRRSNIFLLTSNPFSLVTAMDQGFCGIPITPFSHEVEDIQLNILENYLIKLIRSTDLGQTNINDFGLLTKEISKRRVSSSINVSGLFGSSFIPLKLDHKKITGRKAAIAEKILNVMLPILMSGQEKNQPEEEEKICIPERGR
jgi:hypothetical protein